MSKPTTLYRFFDADGQLLYVGITDRRRARWHEHATTKTWWDTAAAATLVHFDSREEAERAETEAIRTEAPRWNRSGAVLVALPIERPSCEELTELARRQPEAHRRMDVSQIATLFGVSEGTIHRQWLINRHRIKDPTKRFPEPTWRGKRKLYWAHTVIEAWGIYTGRLAGPIEAPVDSELRLFV